MVLGSFQCRGVLLLWHIVVQGPQGGHWLGKCQGSLIFLQGQGKVREICKLNTKKVKEKSWNFIIWAKNILVVADIQSILSV